VRLFALLATARLSFGAYCNGKPDPAAQPNLYPINTDKPIFVKSTKNGAVFTIQNGLDVIPVVHLFGSPYEQGFAHATLMSDEMVTFFTQTYDYIESILVDAIDGQIPWFPPALAQEIALYGINHVLDAEIEATIAFTGTYYLDEIQGMSDALGDKYPDAFKKIERMMLFGELTKGSCSMFGAWGDVIPSGQSLLQLRALDWDMDGPFRDFPQITVYHPSDPSMGVAFANVGFTGFIGSLNGVNEMRLSTSEIGVSFPDDTFGKESRFGVPFTYLLRDILQFDEKLDQALNHITDAARTCDLILGVGDGKLTSLPFRGIQYSHSVANFYIDTDMMPYNETADPQWHPRLSNMVYYGMDWLCPNYDIVLARQLEASRGRLTAALAIMNVTAIEQSGDSLVSYYEYSTPTHPELDSMYVSFAGRHNASGPPNAYDRPFVKMNLDSMFDVAPPTDVLLGVVTYAHSQTRM